MIFFFCRNRFNDEIKTEKNQNDRNAKTVRGSSQSNYS